MEAGVDQTNIEEGTNQGANQIEEEQTTIASNSLFGFMRSGSKFIVAFLLSILFVRLLGAQNYGVYSILTMYWSLAAGLSAFGLNSSLLYGIARYRAKNERKSLRWIVEHNLILLIISSLVASVGLYAAAAPLSVIYHTPEIAPLLRILAIGIVVFNLSESFENQVYIGYQKMKYSFVTGVLFDMLRLAQLAVVYLGFGLLGAITFYDVIYLVVASVGGFFVYRLVKKEPSREKPNVEEIKHIRKYRNFSYASSLVSLFYGPLIVFILGAVAPNLTFVSFYRVGLIMAGLIGVPAAAIGSAFFSSITKHLEHKEFDVFYTLQKKLLKYSALITFPLVFGSIFSAKDLVAYLYKTAFAGAEIPFIIMLIPVLIAGLFGPMPSILSATGRQKYYMYSTIIGSVLGLSLSVLVIPYMLSVGAAVVYAIVSLSMLGSNLFFLSKFIKIKLPYVDFLKGLLAAGVMSAFLYFVLPRVQLHFLPAVLILGLLVYTGMLYITKTINNHEIGFIVKLAKADKLFKLFSRKKE